MTGSELREMYYAAQDNKDQRVHLLHCRSLRKTRKDEWGEKHYPKWIELAVIDLGPDQIKMKLIGTVVRIEKGKVLVEVTVRNLADFLRRAPYQKVELFADYLAIPCGQAE